MRDKPPLTSPPRSQAAPSAEAIRRRALILTINSYVWKLPITPADKLEFAQRLELTATSVLAQYAGENGPPRVERP